VNILEEGATPTPHGYESAIDVEHGEGYVLVRLTGEHDASNCWEIQKEISHAAIEGCGVAISLTDVTFMDSAVIRALVTGDRTLMAQGRRLALHVEPESAADRILELCRLNEVLLFGDTLREAIMFARQSGPSVA
jgi:anti-anti-sigma factor